MSVNSAPHIPLRNGHHTTYDPLYDNPPRSMLARQLDHFFHISERGSSIWIEVRSGLVTFVTMVIIYTHAHA